MTTFFDVLWLPVVGVVVGVAFICSVWKKSRYEPTEKFTVLITGCDSGLGFSLALHSYKLGLTVIASCLNLEGAGATKLREECPGKRMHLIETDVTDLDAVNKSVSQVKAILQTNPALELKCLVNNAAVMVFGEFEWQTERMIRQQVEVNILGTLRITKAFCPMLRHFQEMRIFATAEVKQHCVESGIGWVIIMHTARSVWGRLVGATASLVLLIKWRDSRNPPVGLAPSCVRGTMPVAKQVLFNRSGVQVLCWVLPHSFSLGRIITVSSHCALASLPGLAAYGATKGAIRAWSDSLRVEEAKYGVTVITMVPGSFIGNSSIMSRHSENAKEMEAEMSPDDREFYGDYFHTYHSYLTGLSDPNRPPTVIQDPALHEMFGDALLSCSPSSNYIHGPLRYTIYHFLFKISPVWIRDWLVVKFVQMPVWVAK